MIINGISSHNATGFTKDGWHRAWGNETNLKAEVSDLYRERKGMLRLASVQTAVINEGGVTSYTTCKGVKLLGNGLPSFTNANGLFVGNVNNPSTSPNSFVATPSSTTRSPNLYVSTQATTGTRCSLASIATTAVPARE